MIDRNAIFIYLFQAFVAKALGVPASRVAVRVKRIGEWNAANKVSKGCYWKQRTYKTTNIRVLVSLRFFISRVYSFQGCIRSLSLA